MLSPKTEVFLSYLTGLAPVGESVEPLAVDVLKDCDIRHKPLLYRYLNELISTRCVHRQFCGSAGSIGNLIVLKRLEDA